MVNLNHNVDWFSQLEAGGSAHVERARKGAVRVFAVGSKQRAAIENRPTENSRETSGFVATNDISWDTQSSSITLYSLRSMLLLEPELIECLWSRRG